MYFSTLFSITNILLSTFVNILNFFVTEHSQSTSHFKYISLLASFACFLYLITEAGAVSLTR
jgi:hypothetical protein